MRIEVPTPTSTAIIEVEPSRPAILLGPNGSGKSRLGIYIDGLDMSGAYHRIAAQRSLEMPEEVFSESYDQAIATLRRDKADDRRRKPSPGSMEYAYDQLLTALFAEHHRSLESAHDASIGKARSKRPVTLLDQLQVLWKELIPHQHLIISERKVRAIPNSGEEQPFDGSQLSDGERLIVYMLGQALLLKKDGLLIVDEPELHMSRALLIRLWDVIEQARPDCSFIYITHDVDFAASRRGARMYAVLSYQPPTFKDIVVRNRKRTIEDVPSRWTLEALPAGSELPSEVLVRIVGSRKPILFVEGRTGGLDHLVYKAVYQKFTVIPVESCRQVVQLVRSFRRQNALHWLHCAGLVDMDHRNVDPDGRLEQGLYALPVSEIENLLLVEEIFVALATALSFPADEVKLRLVRLKTEVLDLAHREAERISLQRTSAHIWEASRTLGVKAKSIADLARFYGEMVSLTDPCKIYHNFRVEYNRLLATGDYNAILKVLDNKGGLLILLARSLELHRQSELTAFVARILLQESGMALVVALSKILPEIDSKT